MAEAIGRRSENRAALMDYTFSEIETMEIRGQEEVAPLQSYSKEFAWLQRDGTLVRQPVSINGVPIEESDREAGEIRWSRAPKTATAWPASSTKLRWSRFSWLPTNRVS